jgi:predicted HicB family RNase H-like nuclease
MNKALDKEMEEVRTYRVRTKPEGTSHTRFTLRLPPELHKVLIKTSIDNYCSLNSEILRRLYKSLK